MTQSKILKKDCFGNFNGQLSKCAIECPVVVECYEQSKKDEALPQRQITWRKRYKSYTYTYE